MSSKPDILIFFSDQHDGRCTGYAGHEVVETPNLDRLAAEGTAFNAAYTSYPLCVPARYSFMTGQMTSKNGIFNNAAAIGEDQATFIHSLAAEGYETVLCGRMHFKYEDQRHGFTKRIMDEMTPLYNGRGGDKRKDLGPYAGSFSTKRCLEIIGGGNSPVLEYDRAVVQAALDYLAQDHERPQCLVVGTYAPHFSYVCPPDFYNYYRQKVDTPILLEEDTNYRVSLLDERRKDVDPDTFLRARAAYYGMITNLDSQVGELKDAWDQYLERSNRNGLFVYLSDHGDQAGDRNIVGKKTFYEGAARIPLIFSGYNIEEENPVAEPASILDITPTLCELTGATVPPEQDGCSLVDKLTGRDRKNERYVITECTERDDNGSFIPGRMIRKGDWKYIYYAFHKDQDLLFNLKEDPDELENIRDQYPEKVKELKKLLEKDWDIEGYIEQCRINEKHYQIFNKWGAMVDVPEKERWPVPPSSHQLPEIT